MLVRLTSSTSGEMVMFSEHAHVLFGWIDKECTAHGVFTKEQLPEAIARLRQGVEEEKQVAKRLAEEQRAAAAGGQDDEEEDEAAKEASAREAVSFSQRALPLIRLMEWTLKEEGYIMWEAAKDF